MSDLENIEIRICLIGEPEVGKRSMISRFKILNTSQTITLKNSHSSHLDKAQTNTVNDQHTPRGQDENKKTKFQNDNEVTNKRQEGLNNFSKILTVSKYRIELRFFPISSAVLDLKDNKLKEDEEEDEEIEKDHKLNFDQAKADIEKIINLPTKKGAELKVLFLFVFDMNNFLESFEKIKIYKDELKESTDSRNFNSHHCSALIGNKVDSIPRSFDRKEVNNFLKETDLQYYEISTKMFFSFEKFFEKMFFNHFQNMYEDFSTEYFRERFSNVMVLRETFAKAARKNPEPNYYPSPQDYSSNVYDVEEIKDVFMKKENFKKKIFVNKTGPVFDHKKENFHNKKKKSEGNMLVGDYNKENQEKEEKEFFEMERKKNRIKEEFFTERQGYSFGIRPGKLNLREQKREEKKKHKNVDDIFGIKNITNEPLKRERKKSQQLDEIFQKSQLSKISTKSFSPSIKHAKREKLPSLNLDIRPSILRESSKISKNQSSPIVTSESHTKTESVKFIEEMTKNTEDRVRKKIQFNEDVKEIVYMEKVRAKPKRAKSTRTRIIKKEPFIVPAPNSYDVRGKIDPNKGITFGSRHKINETQNNSGPGFLAIPSDIDIMLRKPKFAAQTSFAPRFKEAPRIILGEIKDIEAKLKGMEENRIRLAQEKLPKFEQLDRKRYNAMIRKEEKENNLRMKYGWYDQMVPDINYNLVEENAPLYSMKGRYERGAFTQDNNYEIGKLYGLDQSVSQLSKNLNKDLTDLPKYNAVKPSLPAYSIATAPRFQEENEKMQVPAPNTYYNLDNNELFMKPGSKHQAYMGKSQRFQTRGANMPGPANYKISGFADDVLKKARKKKLKVDENLSQSDKEDSKRDSTDKRSSEVNAMMNLLDDDHSRIDDSDGEHSFHLRAPNMDEEEEL